MRYWSCWSSPKLTGISPENWLYERLMTWSSVKFVTLLGITPEKAFDERSRKLRPIGSSPEISPERWFRTRLRIFKPVRFPISDGRIPVSELYCKNTECRSVHLGSVGACIWRVSEEWSLFPGGFAGSWSLFPGGSVGSWSLFGCSENFEFWGGASFLFGWWEMWEL